MIYRIAWTDFSPYMDGQDPNLGSLIPETQLLSRAKIVAPYTQGLRIFGCSSGLERTGAVARGLNLKIAMSAWLSRDLSANEREIACLIAVAQAGQADIVIVGSETLYRGDLTEAQLLAYIRRVKQAVPAGVRVTTADVYGELLAHPAIVAGVDVVLANYFPYWEGSAVDRAMAALHGAHQRVVAAAAGKQVMVSETGWPSCGNTIGAAVPSPANASFYFLNFVSWARANNVEYMYFEAFDESWKSAHEGPQGACWGNWDKNGNLKPGMKRVFDGERLPDNWTTPPSPTPMPAPTPLPPPTPTPTPLPSPTPTPTPPEIPGGPGAPAIEFTFVPPYGSFQYLRGRVLHVRPADYSAAVYIKVRGGWWTKPYWSNPSTAINQDGTWTCNITTGGVDEEATTIVAYLVPSGYSPPLAAGEPTLPADVQAKAVAQVSVTRSP